MSYVFSYVCICVLYDFVIGSYGVLMVSYVANSVLQVFVCIVRMVCLCVSYVRV